MKKLVGVLLVGHVVDTNEEVEIVNQRIENRIREREATAERIKLEIGCAYPQATVLEMEVSGRNLAEGVPRVIKLNSNEVLDALREHD